LRFAALSPERPAVRVGFVAVHTRLIHPDAPVFGDSFQLL
jgi:hypothetical protein